LEVAIVEIELELEGRLEWFHSKGRVLEAQRLEQRTKYDIEMLRETGYCSGVENYSQPLGQRPRGSAPWTLLDYFPDDFLMFVDESHITLPQVHGMYKGDFARKTTLVDYGFRLPSALDNRPLSFDEVENRINQVIHVSATPGPFELQRSEQVVEQIIRPTGLLDPSVEIKPTEGQIDDLLGQIRGRAEKGERCLVTTLTKRMAEELSDYLQEMGVRVHYLHSEIDTLQRSEILRDLRLGVFDVVVGINLLREGLDLPEVSLVAILDADKEGYLRSASSLIQTSGRAARHVAGHVIMYADKITDSMHHAIEQTKGRRVVQNEFNAQHNIKPESIRKAVRDFTQRIRPSTGSVDSGNRLPQDASKSSLAHTIKDLESGMKEASKRLEFEKAAMFRDEMIELRKLMVSQEMVDRGSSKVIEMIRDD
jgi:excinuclease ABC subunit B